MFSALKENLISTFQLFNFPVEPKKQRQEKNLFN